MLGARCTSIVALVLAVASGQVDGKDSAQQAAEEVRRLSAALADLDQRLAAVQQRMEAAAGPVSAQERREEGTGGDAQRLEGIADAAQKARQALEYLNERVAGWKPSKPGAGRALAKGIQQYREALEVLPSEPGAAQVLLQAIAEDAMLKSEHCRAAGLAATVKVEVRTLRQQQEVPGWRIKYLPRFRALSKTLQWEEFNRISSPAAENLAPGNYIVWAEDPRTRAKAERVAARVGGHGEREVVIDLAVP